MHANTSTASVPSRVDPQQGPPIGRALRGFAWASFVLNVLIIATGGAVRLTDSGLGCSDWPVCVPGSLVPTPELGIHGVIEFANRTISGPLLLAALGVLIFSWRLGRARRGLLGLSALVLALVLVQAFVGAFVVWQELAAALVGFHYLVSVVIVCLTAAYLVRMDESPGPRAATVPRWFGILAHVTSLVLAVTVFVGVLTTAAGPHSGDADVIRTGVDASVLAHVHSWPGYALGALLVLLTAVAVARNLPVRGWLLLLVLLVGLQVTVGVIQARTGLPELLVGIHMVLAALSAASMTVVLLRLRRPVAG